YDSNAEGSDHVVIELDIGSSAPVQPVTTNGTAIVGQAGRIRGFFVLPYTRQDPSPAYLDDGRVGIAGTQGGADGTDVVVALTVDNAGSTTFDPAAGYRIGVPPGAPGWTPDRFDLDAPLDPGRTATQVVTLRAPAARAAPLQLQLVRDRGNGEPVAWFGRPSDPTEVAAGVAAG
ncbi:MAG: hypothetical protein ABJA89_07060, partial [Lapillicoccus sp.]